MKRLYRFRSAVTGLFVSMAFALRNAATTIRERVKR
jgi:hypothetical protein